jgi:hypothetical protein
LAYLAEEAAGSNLRKADHFRKGSRLHWNRGDIATLAFCAMHRCDMAKLSPDFSVPGLAGAAVAARADERSNLSTTADRIRNDVFVRVAHDGERLIAQCAVACSGYSVHNASRGKTEHG